MPTAGKAPTLDWVLSWGLLCVVTWPSLVVLYLLLNALSFALAASIVKVVLIVPTIQMFLHLLGSYYPFAPRWLEPAFHRWRVARYFAGPHSKSRAVEAVASARQYRPLALPAPGSVQVFDYRPSKAAARTTKGSESLKVVTWNLEFGYLLGKHSRNRTAFRLRGCDADGRHRACSTASSAQGRSWRSCASWMLTSFACKRGTYTTILSHRCLLTWLGRLHGRSGCAEYGRGTMLTRTGAYGAALC